MDSYQGFCTWQELGIAGAKGCDGREVRSHSVGGSMASLSPLVGEHSLQGPPWSVFLFSHSLIRFFYFLFDF